MSNEPEVKISMIVEVDDEVIYRDHWFSLASLEEDLRKPERAIETKLEEIEDEQEN